MLLSATALVNVIEFCKLTKMFQGSRVVGACCLFLVDEGAKVMRPAFYRDVGDYSTNGLRFNKLTIEVV